MTQTAGSAALTFGFAWLHCKLGQGGEEPCDEEDPEEECEPDPEFTGL